MKFSYISATVFVMLALSAGTCAQPNGKTGVVPPEFSTDTSCAEQGGTISIGPESNELTCVAPTSDAGKSCTSSSDCESYCLADTNTCAPTNRYFGCFEERFADGNSATLCVE